jgi:DNA-binding IclR family transcriptional regulator
MSSTSLLDRCLQILEVLAEAPQGMALGAISARTGMAKSATHRMLAALIDSGFVRQNRSRDYRLTMKMTTLGFRFLGQTGLIEHCQAVLDRLADELEELVRMTVVDGDCLVWVTKAQGARRSVVVDPVMGHDVALHATSAGKVWLASLPTEQAVKYVLRDGFGTPQKHGPNVIQSVESLLKELKDTRTQGYGLVWEEAEPGIGAVAVGIPVSMNESSPLIGTVSVAGPVFRLSQERLKAFVPNLQAASQELCALGPLLRFWRDEFTLARPRERIAG